MIHSTRQSFMTASSALRRLPRSLGRLAQPLRAEGYANVRALHSATRAAAASDDAVLGSRAALVASAFAATTLLSATALAEQAAVAATLPNDPADALKSLKSLADAKEIVLYQYEVCPFCNKARTATVVPCDVCPVVARQAPTNTATACFFRCQLRAFLDFHQIPYKVVEVNPLTKKELKWSAYTKVRGRKSIASCQRTARRRSLLTASVLTRFVSQVPVLVVDGEQLNDSSFIIKALDAKLRESGKRNPRLWRPASADAKAEEEKWFKCACCRQCWAGRETPTLTHVCTVLQVGGWSLCARVDAQHIPHSGRGQADV